MKKNICLMIIVLFIFGCSGRKDGCEVYLKINDYTMTKAEFEEQFKDSVFAREDGPEARVDFLNNLISRKLILQDAQEKNLDKDKNFLSAIERFWEQSLLKLVLEKKTKEIAGLATVSDKTIEETYKKMLQEKQTDKPLPEIYSQIKWEITKLKEAEAINNWIQELKDKADIYINNNLAE